MKYIVTWNIPSENYKEAIEIFLSTGAQPPALGSDHGWALVQGDKSAIASHTAEWTSMIELRITHVIEDEQASASLSHVFKK
jgi:hypothetical protein